MSSTGPLLLPSLCHPHIHLDKAYLLSCPEYDDLAPRTGTFSEALSNTSAAKHRYTAEDLRLRGSQLIAESVRYGVTSMRAFIEVDHTVLLKCMEVGSELKSTFSHICHIQLCPFAQDPIFSTEHGEANRKVLEEALEQFDLDIGALGSTPYVETSSDASHANIDWAVDTAIKYGVHLDFHLDYNLDNSREADIWYVLQQLKVKNWNEKNEGRTVALGHCTRHTLFSTNTMRHLKHLIELDNLPVFFIGLPTSDLYMMGRSNSHRSEADPGGHADRPRGTLQIPSLIKDYCLDAAIGINNVGNAFTPWGSADPLRLASLCVGIYQAGTDAQLLYECISTRARKALGIGGTGYPKLRIMQDTDTNIHNIPILARQRRSIRDVIYEPPDAGQRENVYLTNVSDRARYQNQTDFTPLF